MNNVMVVLKERWYLIVGALLGLWLIVKLAGHSSGGGASSSASIPAGVAVQYTGTSANDAAVQIAQLQQQSNVASQQIAGVQQIQQAQIALQAQQDIDASNITINAGNNAAAVTINGSNNAAAVHTSDNATALGIAQSQYALAITNSNNAAASHASDNATALGIVQSNNAQTVAIAQAGDALQLGLDTNAKTLAALENTNATQLSAYGIQASVANNQIAALKSIATTVSNNAASVQEDAINSATQLQASKIAQQNQIIQDTYSLTASGVFNKGGAGGTNQVAVWNALSNPSSASAGDAASAAVATAQASTLANVISAFAPIGNAINNGIKTLTS